MSFEATAGLYHVAVLIASPDAVTAVEWTVASVNLSFVSSIDQPLPLWRAVKPELDAVDAVAQGTSLDPAVWLSLLFSGVTAAALAGWLQV